MLAPPPDPLPHQQEHLLTDLSCRDASPETLLDLRAAIGRLRLAERQLLMLIYVEGRNCHQAAAVLHLSHQATRQRLSRLRKKIRTMITDREKER